MTMPTVLSALTDQQREQHSHFPTDIPCMYWGEYTSYEHTNGARADFSPTNRLISNLKKKMERRGQADFRYKQQAIMQCAISFYRMINWQDIATYNVAFVPMPPSRAQTDPNYDPRIFDILTAMKRNVPSMDIRDCLRFDGRHVASHEASERPSIDELYASLLFNPVSGRVETPPGGIVIFDDMLTTGAHFVAASRRLSEAFPNVPIVPYFIARRVAPNAADAFTFDLDFL